MSFDQRRTAPAATRNRDVILAVLQRVIDGNGSVLEIASGTGQHAVHCATAMPGVQWLPSDPDESALSSIAAWRDHDGPANLLAPVQLNVTEADWLLAAHAPFSAVVCINMIHIAPWEAAVALFSGAAQHLRADGVLYLYGPFKRGGEHTSESNAAFDRQLRSNDRRWGVRDLEAVSTLAQENGFDLPEVVAMPANNLSLIFRRAA